VQIRLQPRICPLCRLLTPPARVCCVSVRTAFTAAFLLFVGVLFSTLGLSFLFTLGLSEALPFLIIGGIGQDGVGGRAWQADDDS
jgi:hypothetical protein